MSGDLDQHRVFVFPLFQDETKKPRDRSQGVPEGGVWTPKLKLCHFMVFNCNSVISGEEFNVSLFVFFISGIRSVRSELLSALDGKFS